MFSHIMVGVTDFERALAFYKPVLDGLGIQFRFQDDTHPWAGWQSAYSTPWRTRFHADGGQCSSVMADTVPR